MHPLLYARAVVFTPIQALISHLTLLVTEQSSNWFPCVSLRNQPSGIYHCQRYLSKNWVTLHVCLKMTMCCPSDLKTWLLSWTTRTFTFPCWPIPHFLGSSLGTTPSCLLPTPSGYNKHSHKGIGEEEDEKCGYWSQTDLGSNSSSFIGWCGISF